MPRFRQILASGGSAVGPAPSIGRFCGGRIRPAARPRAPASGRPPRAGGPGPQAPESAALLSAGEFVSGLNDARGKAAWRAAQASGHLRRQYVASAPPGAILSIRPDSTCFWTSGCGITRKSLQAPERTTNLVRAREAELFVRAGRDEKRALVAHRHGRLHLEKEAPAPLCGKDVGPLVDGGHAGVEPAKEQLADRRIPAGPAVEEDLVGGPRTWRRSFCGFGPPPRGRKAAGRPRQTPPCRPPG